MAGDGAPGLPLPPASRLAVAAAVLAAGLALAVHLAGEQLALGLSALLGLVFGVVLQRSRLCFYCLTRDFLERRDARGVLGLLAALALGTAGYHLVFGAFLPVPVAGRLPPGAHIGPVSWVLALGAFAFGLGMATAGSCISAHLYRLGEGSLVSIVALLGAVLGFVLGFLSWNPLYLGALQSAPVVWLPHHLGYAGSAALQLLVLGALAARLAARHRAPVPVPVPEEGGAWWQRRWPAHVGGLLVGTLGVLAYLRVAPLGVTAELGSWARTGADTLHLLPERLERLEGLDGFAGCATVLKQTLWSNNGAFVVALVLGAFAAAWLAGDFRPRRPTGREWARALVGGVLMGWGAMVALGCTVGTLLSGVMAGALSGWVFGLAGFAGLWLGWRLRR